MNVLQRPDPAATAAMLHMIAGFRVSRAIYVAAKLGVADLLRDGAKTSEELAVATGTDASSLYRVMRVLASAGVFALEDNGRFALNAVALTLLTDVAVSLRGWAIEQLGGEHYQAWGDVMHSVRTGSIAFDHVFGKSAWAYRSEHPESARDFDEAMASFVGVHNDAVLASYPFATLRKVVDVGGGEGKLLAALLQANRETEGVLFELPHVAEKARRRIAQAGLTARCEVVAGDVFESVPPGGDAYLLSRVIHDWDDDRAVAILRNCRRAMTSTSRLIIVERVIPPRIEQSMAMQALVVSDLNMMVMNGGRERTEAQYRALLEAAGFALTTVVATGTAMSVIEGVPR